jgi:hypothetical protein
MTRTKQVSPRGRAPRFAFAIALIATLMTGEAALADAYEDINLTSAATCHATVRTFGVKVGESVPANTDVGVTGSGNLFWNVAGPAPCTGAPNSFDCPGPPQKFHIDGPPPDPAVANTTVVAITSDAVDATDQMNNLEGNFSITATEEADPTKTCTQQYRFHVVSASATGGWGDPHLTTVNGVHYDFQSAGEFTALRKDGWELQTRQVAVPTATVPITNEYTGITHCVALYSAVAAKLGSSRVTLQPKDGDVDPRSMQLRVNGKPVELTDAGIVLSSGDPGPGGNVKADGQIKKAAGGAIEIVNVDGTQIVVTPAFWEAHQVWYLNLKVHQVSATRGTMGFIPEGNWLPALPDGTLLGARPDTENARYQQLYETFADAWRVTDSTSLFDYASGTNTATFTLEEWPRNNPQSCGIEGQTPAEPTTQEAAEQACANVTDANEKADCIFDVAITGNLGFGKSYETMQSFQPAGSGWQAHADIPSTGGGEPPPTQGGIPWWVWLLIILILILIIWLIRRKSTP